MFRLRIHRIIIYCLFIFFVTICAGYSYEDGFTQARKVESKHFSIFYAAEVEEDSLARKLNITQADRILAGADVEKDSLSTLPEMLDILFLRVCDTLDMQLYSFKGNIKICKDYGQLNNIYNNLFAEDLGGVLSFYVSDLNTIYVCAESFRREILGHEIAHAVISRYFVVQPSMKVQEVLAGYVEYQLRKSTK